MNNAGGKDIISYSKQEVIKLTMIDIRNLTKDYGGGKGVFGVSISIKKGEVYGYLGPNGAGKSTTMRHLMGFIRSQSGTVLIDGMDCWRDQKKIQKNLGYLPGEISFPDNMTGTAYLKLIGKMRGMKSFSYAEELLDLFKLDTGSGICFCSSCIFNTSKNSLTFGAGIPLYFFVVSMFIELSDDLDFLKNFTLNTLFDTQKILEGSGYIQDFIIMGVLALMLYAVGIIWFEKKDLPL